MKPKQPYIPLYIGDWERDTNCLSVGGEFALLKLTFKLFNAEKKGQFIANYRTLSILFKSNLDETKAFFNELIENNILDIEEIEPNKFCIKSRRMIREGNISTIKSEAGLQGGRGNKSKRKAKAKQTESKSKAKVKQNPDIDNDIIVKQLNAASGKNFSPDTVKTIELISARKRDGFTLKDFETVIKFKCSEWLDDEKMCEYLRPETLFGNKFESYLNSVPKKQPTKPNTISQSEYAKP